MQTQRLSVKFIVIAVTGLLSCLYLGQGFLVKLRLDQLNSELVPLNFVSEHCDAMDCEGRWEIRPQARFLLLGHVLRTHKLIESNSRVEKMPIARVSGTVADSWGKLRVYEVQHHSTS